MTLGEHLRELRTRLVRALVAVAVGLIVGWALYDLTWLGDLVDPLIPGAADALHERGIWSALSTPIFHIAEQLGLDPEKITLNFVTLTGAIDVRFQVSLVAGIILSSPAWLYQIFAFFVPGLNKRERRYVFGFFFTAVPLFLLGVAAGWFVLPRIIELMFHFVPPAPHSCTTRRPMSTSSSSC